MMTLTLTLISRAGDGTPIPPRTKKNHGQIIQVRGRPVMLPSPEYRAWEDGCARASLYDRTAPAITYPVNCEARIYRDRNTGDAVGYYQAIADCLEHLGVVQNDRLIVSWDGTRLLKDDACPRVEITLTAVAEAQQSMFPASVEETRMAAIATKKARATARKAARA